MYYQYLITLYFDIALSDILEFSMHFSKEFTNSIQLQKQYYSKVHLMNPTKLYVYFAHFSSAICKDSS